jgi:hypothetical protein
MGSKVLFIAIATEIGVVTAAASGCATGSSPHGFGSSPATTTATPLGAYAASTSMQQKYGIAEWRSFVGRKQIVVTGYRADGTAARGVQLAWFPKTSGSVGHTRLMMLDGSGAVLRRMVGGGESGHLSGAQIELLQTMRYDLSKGPMPASSPLHGTSFGAGGGSLHPLDWPSSFPVSGNTPGTGPQCLAAWNNPSIPIDASGCGFGAATFETVMGGVVALGTCTQWYGEVKDAQAKCDAENQASCNNTDGTCNFGQDDAGAGAGQTPMPQSQCDQDCICANYGTSNGMPCSRTCVDNGACDSGQECHWGSCGPAAAKNDNPTDQNVQQQNGTTPSCGNGDVTTDPSTGQAGCSNGGTAGGGSGGSSGGGGSSGSSSGTDTTGGDPTGGSGGGSGAGSSGGSGGGQCASDGAGCAQDADCCAGSCNSGTCGVTDSSSSGGSGSSSGGGCAADGSACAQDSDCCGGTCDTSTGTCGSGSGSSSSSSGGSGSSSGGGCGADGSACAQDADCCGGTCDTSTGTCGTPSGSSGGSSSSGSSSGGGSCAPDGSACAQNSDCCGGTCSSGTCGAAPTCGSPGNPCAQDTDCCSGSCDTASGTCN